MESSRLELPLLHRFGSFFIKSAFKTLADPYPRRITVWVYDYCENNASFDFRLPCLLGIFRVYRPDHARCGVPIFAQFVEMPLELAAGAAGVFTWLLLCEQIGPENEECYEQER